MKVAVNNDWTHNPVDESHWVSCLRENLTSSSYGEGLETGWVSLPVPRQSFTRQLDLRNIKTTLVSYDLRVDTNGEEFVMMYAPKPERC